MTNILRTAFLSAFAVSMLAGGSLAFAGSSGHGNDSSSNDGQPDPYTQRLQNGPVSDDSMLDNSYTGSISNSGCASQQTDAGGNCVVEPAGNMR